MSKLAAPPSIQEGQYEFPYHHLAHIDDRGNASLSKRLGWGLEYLCYQRHLREKVSALKPLSVLEVGCGDGVFIGSLPLDIPIRVGVDLSSRAIGFAKAFFPHCAFYAVDVDTLNRTFDIVVAVEVLEHVSDEHIEGFLQSLDRRLADGGAVVISVPTTNIPLNKKHYRHYTLALLKAQIDLAGLPWTIENVEYIYRDPWWGRVFRRVFDNRLFSFEFKPFTRLAWRIVWRDYRFALNHSGHHLIATVRRKSQTQRVESGSRYSDGSQP